MSEQMAIYILEDQIIQAKALEVLLTNILHSRNIYNETIHLFSRSDELLQVAHQDAQLNIFFLDIQMNNHIQAGFEVAKEIRKTDSESLIVFISTHTELVLTSYKYMVSALQFIQKNVDFLDFQKEVETCVDAYIQQKENIKTKSEYIIINLKASSIKWILMIFISFKRNTIIVCQWLVKILKENFMERYQKLNNCIQI